MSKLNQKTNKRKPYKEMLNHQEEVTTQGLTT